MPGTGTVSDVLSSHLHTKRILTFIQRQKQAKITQQIALGVVSDLESSKCLDQRIASGRSEWWGVLKVCPRM